MSTADLETPPSRRHILASRDRRRARRKDAGHLRRAWRSYLAIERTPIMYSPFAGMPGRYSADMEDLQRRMKADREASGACVNDLHDHLTHLLRDGTQVGKPVAMLCWECGEPGHYDLLMKTYCHDDPDVPTCAEMDPNLVNPCTPKE